MEGDKHFFPSTTWQFYFFAIAAFFAFTTFSGLAATYPVTSLSDSGAGSLRQAILTANTNPGPDTITFQISGTKPFTIALASSLPTISDSVTIDGTTQSGFTGSPVVELNGAAAGSGVIGLKLAANGNIVRGLAVNRFTAQGIELDGSSNVIQGNFIGTDTTGTTARGNGSFGVWVKSAWNLIGGTNSGDGNLISGGNNTGIYLSSSYYNSMQGNIIGLTLSGGVVLSNLNNGIVIDGGSGNVIGGTDPSMRNIISGNGASGIYLNGSGTSSNFVSGNFIGVNITGSGIASNRGDGITLNGAAKNFIGMAGAGNVISGNNMAGISVVGSTAISNQVCGNYIGLDATGKNALANRYSGVVISGGNANQIGGEGPGAGNIISGNLQDGVFLTSGSVSNLVLGNWIGLSGAGTNALSNGNNGISISGGSFNQIGGATSGARNVISGNSYNGIGVLLLNDINNRIAGNYIGTDSAGKKSIANTLAGIRLQACSNVIGNANVISGNGQQGIWLVGTNGNVMGNTVQGNFIGLDASGTNSLGNGNAGIGITSAANNQIGGISSAMRNIIAANNDAGIFLIGNGTTNNQIQGNFIGTDVSGTLGRGNLYEGIYLQQANTNLIGGDIIGAGNLISANNTRGIWLTNASQNVLQGNFIGTKADGTNGLGNVFHGIDLDANATNNIIGGTTPGAGNRLAYAQSIYSGVRVRDGSVNNLISGNAIFNNGALGIDLGVFGVTAIYACESGVPANAANAGQNFPVLSNVYSATVTRIIGTLNSKPNQSYRLQFFADPAADSSGYGEGQIFLGQTDFALGSGCSSNFAVTLPAAVPLGWVVTATATSPANNTSEFSAAATVLAIPSLRLKALNENQVQISWTNTSAGLILQQTFSLSPPIQWNNVTNQPVLGGGNWTANLAKTNSSVFYRLTAP